MSVRGPKLIQGSYAYPRKKEEKKGASAGSKIAASLGLLEKGISITDKHREKQLSYSGLLTDEQFQFEDVNKLGDPDLFKMFERVPVDDPGMVPNPITYFQEATKPITHRIQPTQRALNHPDIGHEGIMKALNKADRFNKKDISNIVFKEDYSNAFKFTDAGEVENVYPHRDVDVEIPSEEIGYEHTNFNDDPNLLQSEKELINSLDPKDRELVANRIKSDFSPTEGDFTWGDSSSAAGKDALNEVRESLGGTDKYGLNINNKEVFEPLGYQPDVNNQEIYDSLDALSASFQENVSGPAGDAFDKINTKGAEFVNKGKDAIAGKLGEETAKNMGAFAKSAGKVASVASQVYGGYRVAKGVGKGDVEEVIHGAIQLATPALIAAGPAGWAVLGLSYLEDVFDFV